MMLQRCVAIRESCMGPTHPETAISYSHYATLLRAAKCASFPPQGLTDFSSSRKDAAKAELLYNRALAILQSGSNPNSAQVAGVLNDQGMLFALTRREKEAEAAFLKVPRHSDMLFRFVLSVGSVAAVDADLAEDPAPRPQQGPQQPRKPVQAAEEVRSGKRVLERPNNGKSKIIYLYLWKKKKKNVLLC
jgi:hypothetical protein